MSIILLFSLLVSSIIINVSATSSTDELQNIEKITLSSNQTVEKKILCDATLDDDFKDDSVIVVFKNSKSRNLNDITVNTFSEISAKEVRNLTGEIDKKIDKQRQSEYSLDIQSSITSPATLDELYVDENKYHQIVAIDLGIKSKENVLKCVKVLEKRDDVLMAFPNYIYRSAKTPNDPKYTAGSQWAINKIKLPEAWEYTTGSTSVKVGVIDSGIYGEHIDLTNCLNQSLGGVYTGIGTKFTDEGGHGTAVAGVIGAKGNNSTGITGACWNISIVSLKAAVDEGDHCSMGYEEFVAALTYATNNNIPILNYSYNSIDNDNAVKIALGNYPGLLVCAAGNSAVDISNSYLYPTEMIYDNMIIVAGTDQSDKLYYYEDDEGKKHGSNYSATKVDLAAPGYEICTTSSSGSYTTVNGTSLAAPYVTGVAALLKSKYPKMDAAALKANILNNVDIIPELKGKVSTSGRLNAYKALSNPEKFTVRYIPNGGGGSTMQNSEIIRGCSTALRANTYTRDGYTFNYWYAKRPDSGLWYYTNGTDKDWYLENQQPPGYYKYQYRDKQAVSRTAANGKYVEMYAQWKIDKFNLTFNSNNGTKTMPYLTVDYDDSFNIPSNVFYREGFTFDHWYAKNQDGNLYYVNGNNGGWYTIDSRPSGYTRLDIADKSNISYDTFNDISNGDTITLCAYWKPNSGELGDADNSGKVNITDATHIQNYLSNTVDEGDINLSLADVNFDGEVTISDVTLLNKFLAKLIDEFGV